MNPTMLSKDPLTRIGETNVLLGLFIAAQASWLVYLNLIIALLAMFIGVIVVIIGYTVSMLFNDDYEEEDIDDIFR